MRQMQFHVICTHPCLPIVSLSCWHVSLFSRLLAGWLAVCFSFLIPEYRPKKYESSKPLQKLSEEPTDRLVLHTLRTRSHSIHDLRGANKYSNHNQDPNGPHLESSRNFQRKTTGKILEAGRTSKKIHSFLPPCFLPQLANLLSNRPL